MNKILVDGELWELTEAVNTVKVLKEARIFIGNLATDIDLTINMPPKTKLDIYDFNLSDKKAKIVVHQVGDSHFNYYHTFKIQNNYSLDYYADIAGNNNENNITIRGITMGDVNINIDGHIAENSAQNILNEDIKVLNKNGQCVIKPMMHVNAQDVIANHNTAISNIRDDELFYLMAKGISADTASKLIENSYLYGLFKGQPEIMEKINRI